jgi:hypothetical protein
VSGIGRTWLTAHSAQAAAIGLLGLCVLTWAVGRGVVEDRLTNPLGETYASLTVTLILPVLAVTLLPIALHDRVEASIALAARSLVVVRATWWLTGLAVTGVCLAPVQTLTGAAQLRIDILLLAGLSTLALCAFGLGPALAVPLLVLLPHLARRSGAPPHWWTVLATADLPATSVVAVTLAAAGLLAYAWAGPRTRPELSGGGVT